MSKSVSPTNTLTLKSSESFTQNTQFHSSNGGTAAYFLEADLSLAFKPLAHLLRSCQVSAFSSHN